MSQKAKKAPRPDRLGAPVLGLIWGWERERMHLLATHAFRLEVHPHVLRRARGVPIPKPNRGGLGC